MHKHPRVGALGNDQLCEVERQSNFEAQNMGVSFTLNRDDRLDLLDGYNDGGAIDHTRQRVILLFSQPRIIPALVPSFIGFY